MELILMLMVVAGPVLGIVALSRGTDLRRRLERLEGEMWQLKTREEIGNPAPSPVPSVVDPVRPSAVVASPIPVVSRPVPKPTLSQSPPPLPSLESVLLHPSAPAVDLASSTEELASSSPADSLELDLGRVWFVRIGVVLVLTALALLANFAYGRLDPDIQPVVHASALFLISFGLLGAGLLLPRRWENLQAYGQVLTAGGLAAIYFTTYSIHFHFNFLPPVPTGGLLLAWAGFIVWLADRRQSEIMALFAIGGAFYASFIPLLHGSGGGVLMLASNLALALASIWFLLRNRWVNLTYLSLAAVYGAFAAWRFIYAPHFADFSKPQALTDLRLFGIGLAFQLAYWVVFNVAALISRGARLAGWPRALLLGANTGFLFLYLALPLSAMQGSYPNTFWILPAALGLAVLGLSARVRHWLPSETHARDTLLVQGLALVTLATTTYQFTGPHSALVLASQSVLLLYLGLRHDDLLLRFGAYAVGGLSLGWALGDMAHLHATAFQLHPASLRLGVFVGLALFVNSWLCKRFRVEDPTIKIDHRSAGFVAGAASMALATTLFNTIDGWREGTGLLLAGLGLLFTLGTQILRVREMAWGGQVLMLAGQAFALMHLMKFQAATPWWCPALVGAATLIQLLWWRYTETESTLYREGWESVHALVLAAMALASVYAFIPIAASRLWVLPLVGLASTTLALAGRQWRLAICSQLIPLAACLEFGNTVLFHAAPPALLVALAPIVGLLALGLATQAAVDWPIVKEEIRPSLMTMIRVYLAVATGMILICLLHTAYVLPAHRVWVAGLVGLVLFVWHGVRPQRDRLVHSAVFAATALLVFWDTSPEGREQSGTLAFILGLLLQQQATRHWVHRYVIPVKAHQIVILLGSASLVVWLSRWVMGELAVGFYLTASWAALAFGLLLAGLLLRERTYRLAGLALLALALGRLGVFDIWNLQDKIARSLSVLALGVVLLALGFIYNRYQDTIRKWL